MMRNLPLWKSRGIDVKKALATASAFFNIGICEMLAGVGMFHFTLWSQAAIFHDGYSGIVHSVIPISFSAAR